MAERAETVLEPEHFEHWEAAYQGYVQRRADWLRMVGQFSQSSDAAPGE
jgi:hypothetical protein